MAEKLTIISSFEQHQKGEVFEQFPLHITLLPWFDVPYRQSLLHSVQNFATRQSPQRVEAAGEAMFGPNEDIRVRLLGRVGSLHAMHEELLEIVSRQHGEILTPEFVDKKYVPHVTYQGDYGLEEGEVRTIDRLQVVSGDMTGPRKVVADLGLSKGKR